MKKTIYANAEAARADVNCYIHGLYNPKPKPALVDQMSPLEFQEQHQQAERFAAGLVGSSERTKIRDLCSVPKIPFCGGRGALNRYIVTDGTQETEPPRGR